MPEEGVELSPSEKILTRQEIYKIAKLFAVNCGVNKIKITGGEPTVRKDLIDIVKDLKSISHIQNLGITTNGYLLPRKL